MKKKRSDKERLDFLSKREDRLRSQAIGHVGQYVFRVLTQPFTSVVYGDDLRKTIDRAMDAQEKGGGRGE